MSQLKPIKEESRKVKIPKFIVDFQNNRFPIQAGVSRKEKGLPTKRTKITGRKEKLTRWCY